MDVSTYLALSLSFQVAANEEAISPSNAQSMIHSEVDNDIPKGAAIFKKIPFIMLKLERRGPIYRARIDALINELVHEYYCTQECKLLELPSSLTSRYGSLSSRAMRRVFYLEHDDYQYDDWSCGYRAACGAAALHDLVSSGAALLDSKRIGVRCRRLRERSPTFEEYTHFINEKAKIRAAVALLRRDQQPVDRAIMLLERDDVDMQEVMLQLMPDYFITSGAYELLSKADRVCDAISLLGKADSKEVKAVSRRLVDALVDVIKKDDQLTEKVEKLAQELFQEIQGLTNPETEVRNLIARAQDDTLPEMILIALNCGHRNVRYLLDAARKNGTQLGRRLEDLATVVTGYDVSALDVTTIVHELGNKDHPLVAQAVQDLCAKDKRLSKILEIRKRSVCPHIKAAISLLFSKDPWIDEVIGFLRKSHHSKIGEALSHVEKDHKLIISIRSELSQLLNTYQQEKVDKIIDVLIKVNRKEVEDAVKLLKTKPSVDETLRKVANTLEAIDFNNLTKAFQTIDPEYPQDFSAKAEKTDIEQVIAILRKIEEKDIKDAIALLCIHSKVSEAIPLVLKSSNRYKDDAVALLRSDHTRDTWSIPTQHILASQELRGLTCRRPCKESILERYHITDLVTHPSFALPTHTVHVLGDSSNEHTDERYKGLGITFDLSDPILLTRYSEFELEQKERYSDVNKLSAEVEGLIFDDWKGICSNENAQGAHYFICNKNNNHWIVVAIIKFARKKPLLVALDSKNSIVTQSANSAQTSTDAYISYIYNKFIKPF